MNDHPERPKFPRAIVLEVFLELGKHFDPCPAWHWNGKNTPDQRPDAMCERFCAVGGYRRGKLEMKDLEILYIPRFREEENPGDLFGSKIAVNITDRMLEGLLTAGVLVKRLKCDGSISSWGPENKHAVHVASGLPIDFFSATEENYFNRLVVTTGPADLNIRIAGLARKKGFEWEVAEAGFVKLGGTWENSPNTRVVMKCEKDVFDFVGLPYFAPEQRHKFVSA